MFRIFLVFTTLILAVAPLPAVDFHADVAPVLREYCAGCHNDDDWEGDLSVETFKSLMEGGESGAPIEPGDADASMLVPLLLRSAKPHMPPRKEPQLSPEQIAVIRKWIDEGAKGPAEADDVSILSNLVTPEIEPAADAPSPITAIAIAPDGGQVMARFGEVIYAGRVLTSGLPGKVNALEFSADGKRLAIASGVTGLKGIARVVEVPSGETVNEFGSGHRDALYDAAISPDGKILATGGYDRLIQLWDIASGERLKQLTAHNGAVYDLAFSPDGSVLASASGDESVKLWNVASGERLDTLGQPEGEVFNVHFTPDGKSLIAAGADRRLYLWEWVSRDKPTINPLKISRFAHEDEIVRLAIAGEGKVLVSSSADGVLRTWSVPGLQMLEQHSGQPDLAAALAFAADGSSFVAARMDGSLGTYKVGPVAATDPGTGSDREVHEPASTADMSQVAELEGDAEMRVQLPVKVTGSIGDPGDVDRFRFAAKAGEQWVMEVDAARSQSKLDSKIAVLDASGAPIERVKMQALRESWLTFRGRDSTSSGDFRVHNWRLMELNEMLYVNGEVVKLWLYPRGPDSGFIVYPGTGKRKTYFDTTPVAHPLGQPCYTVVPLEPGASGLQNGLPVFPIYYENDDESNQRWGSDSKLTFTAPADGDYVLEISDVRGFGGEGFDYTLTARPLAPEFKIDVTKSVSPSPGSGKEFVVNVTRIDDFEGEIRIDIADVPPGFSVTNPIVIEAGQISARGVVFAQVDAPPPPAGSCPTLTATATIAGSEVKRAVGGLEEIKLGEKAKLRVELAEPEINIRPGETVVTSVRVIRDGHTGQVRFGNEDSGRNLPHGVFVDNIGLSGLLVPAGKDEREFMITAAPWVPEGSRQFHLLSKDAGGQACRPVTIHVRK